MPQRVCRVRKRIEEKEGRETNAEPDILFLEIIKGEKNRARGK